MSISSLELQDIDILSDSLSLMGEDVDSMNDDGTVRYGDIILNIAAKVSMKSAFSHSGFCIISSLVFILHLEFFSDRCSSRKARYVGVCIFPSLGEKSPRSVAESSALSIPRDILVYNYRL